MVCLGLTAVSAWGSIGESQGDRYQCSSGMEGTFSFLLLDAFKPEPAWAATGPVPGILSLFGSE